MDQGCVANEAERTITRSMATTLTLKQCSIIQNCAKRKKDLALGLDAFDDNLENDFFWMNQSIF